MSNSISVKKLFSGEDLYEFLETRKKSARDWIFNLTEQELENPEEEVLGWLLAKFELQPIALNFDAAEIVEQGSKKINVRGDHRFWSVDEDAEPVVDGNFIKLAIPYTGNQVLFAYKPLNYTTVSLTGQILDSEVHITLEDAVKFTQQSILKLKNERFSGLKHCMIGSMNQVGGYNDWLNSQGLSLIQKRQADLSSQNSLVQELGFKIRKRTSQPVNVTQPIVRKKLSAVEQVKGSSTKVNDPVLEMATYEEILAICRNMAKVMELSPHAFHKIPEEDLRFHFLVQLNGVFEGQATGETFNVGGKTDIIIKHKGENLFIAECKYWTGEANYQKAIDQLLGYVSWHDTKTAMIVFCKNKDFSSVLEKLRTETLQHVNCTSQLDYSVDCAFRYKFRHAGDSAKALIMTVLAFHVPT